MELKRVVVTGLGAVTPLGNTAAETWENMVAGVSGAGPITKFDTEKFKTKFACEVKDFDPAKFIDRKEARKMDPYCQYALSAATMAVEDCGMDLKAVDKNRIGALGICGGGGYTLNAAKSDKRMKAVATISMFNSGRVRREGYMDSQKDSVQERLKAANDARQKAVETGKHDISGHVDFETITPERLKGIPTDLYREGLIYYGQTHRHPNSTFDYTTDSLSELMTWDATDQIDLINVPLLMIAGSKADSLYMTEDAYQKATGTTDKELFEIPGATHIQTYYVPKYVNQAMAKLTEFFGRTLR